MNSTSGEVSDNSHLELPPVWAEEAIWYQIMVERFRNGDVSNDPTKKSIEGGTVDEIPPDWSTTPWSRNWYKKDSWMENMPVDFYRGVQLRRYGGDLQGVMEKLPYLRHLGINAIYFNPLNFAPSSHKYDTSSYHHIDPYFGPDPDGDLRMIATENPNAPEEWVWTKADLLWLEFLQACHDSQIRVIVDFSWNHTGHTFWAFEDIKRHKSKSIYLPWYQKVAFIRKGNQDVMTYMSWNQVSTLPELKKINLKMDDQGMLRGDMPTDLKKHIFAVCKRWINPVVNGCPQRGIDGMRLDVADLVPVDFWKELKQFTRSLNPEFFLVGEIWWEEWPHKLKDTKPWLQGDILDSVMHYHWFKAARMYFGENIESSDVVAFIGKIQEIYSNLKVEHCRALMNVAATHDSPRVLTSLFNKNNYKYRCKPNEDPHYLTGIPDDKTFDLTALLIIHQFTFLGSPHIWNGDEMGMVGADDPDNRKPLMWPDIHFDSESSSEYSEYQNSFKPSFNATLFKVYRDLIKLRKLYPVFQKGDCLFYTEEIHESPLLIYNRHWQQETFSILINRTANALKTPGYVAEMKVVYRYNVLDTHSTYLPPYSAIIKKTP